MVVRSLLADLIGQWVATAAKMPGSSADLYMTCCVIRVLSFASMLPDPLGRCIEMFDRISAQEIGAILEGLWRYLEDTSEWGSNDPTNEFPSQWMGSTHSTSKPVANKYLLPMKTVLHNNVSHLGHHYGRLFGSHLM